MKLILLVIFNIVCFNSISAKIIKPSDIIKRSNFNLKNKTRSYNYSIFGNNFKDDKKEIKKIVIEADKKAKLLSIKDIDPNQNFKTKQQNNDEVINDKKCSDLEKVSLFMACCIKGGVTPAEFSDACIWALENNYIKNENHLNIPINDFAQKIAKQFETTYHDDWKIREANKQGQYLVIDSNRKIIFNYDGFKN